MIGFIQRHKKRGKKKKGLRWEADRISNVSGCRFRLPGFLLKKSIAGKIMENCKVKMSDKWDNFF